METTRSGNSRSLVVALAAAAPPDLPVGSLFRLNVPVQPTGNARLNVYTNDYVGDSPSLSARRPGSNIVSTTVSQPDLLIAARSALTDRDLPVAPLLAIEVLSPSTRHFDLGIKRALYESAGCAAYWVLDPDEPSITVWELRDGQYAEVARAVGSESLRLHTPVEV